MCRLSMLAERVSSSIQRDGEARAKKAEIIAVIPQTKTKHVYTIAEAEYLALSEATIRRLIKRGLLRRSHSVGKILIPGLDVERFMERTCR